VKNSNNSSSFSLSVNNNKYSNPNIKYINIDSYSDEETLLQDVSNGKSVDFIYNLNRELDASNENFSEYNKKEYVTPVITAIFLNPNKKDILAKKNLRKNIYYGVERETISSGALGQAKSSFDILPGSNFRNDLVKETEISVSSSSTINLTIVDNEKQNKIAENIKTSLGKIGLNINIIKEDQSNVINSIIKNRDFEMLLYSIEVNNLEDLYAFWHSSQRNAPGLNITNYTSTNLDKNLNIIKTSTSTTEIQESLESMVKEFYDEYPYIPLYTSVEYIYKKNNLTINSPDQISNKKEITSDIINWYKDKEKIWPIIKKYENQITKIYKLIH
jgi:ABC-type transport system substrate-binding protein